MPLVFAVVVIITIIVVLNDAQKNYNRESANYTKMYRKTNSFLERETLDKFMRQGMTFDEAYLSTMNEMVRLGYEPCIPADAYGQEKYRDPFTDGETSCVYGAGEYDSFIVKTRRELLYNAKKQNRQKLWNDDRIYEDFPVNRFESRQEAERWALKYKTLKKGQYIIYPGYGTCEILDHKYYASGTKGYYKVRIVLTNQIAIVPIGDEKIRLMDNRID